MCRLRGRDVATIASRPEKAPAGPPAWGTYFWVASVDETLATVTDAGGSVAMEPFDALRRPV